MSLVLLDLENDMFGIIEKIKNLIVNKYTGSIVRTALAAAIGVLAASTIPGASELAETLTNNLPQLEAAISTILGYAIIQLWSWLQKSREAKVTKAGEVVISQAEYDRLLKKK